MKKSIKYLLVFLSLIFTFVVIYSPHFSYHFPFHIDEWHHITETMKLSHGEYQFQGLGQNGATMGFEIGFHILLIPLTIFNFVNIYQFLPAIWGLLSALVLFFVVYKKTNNYWIALFSIIFFTSLKSNVNIAGLWFFTPLTFSIPFIFLYFYFFTEGIENQNKKQILISLAIMVFIVFIHAVSFLFSVPILLIYTLFHYRYLKKEPLFFSSFLIIPILGIIFYAIMSKLSFFSALSSLFSALQFKYGWGVLEIKNSPLEIYSWIGYILAILGVLSIIIKKQKKLYVYLLWTFIVLASIIFYRIFGVSYLSPYQRNFYYFAISLPILSSIGLYTFISEFNLKKYNTLVKIIICLILFFLAFFSYYSIPSKPNNLNVYRSIDSNDYQALLFLQNQPHGKVLASPFVSEAIFPISGQDPVATVYFYGDKKKSSQAFFSAKNCSQQDEILKEFNVSYVLTKSPIGCNRTFIYNKADYIYRI